MRDFSPSNALFADLYELTMAQAYWQSGHTQSATFSMFFRKYPPDRAYFVFAGLQDVLDYLSGWRFSADDLEYLKSLNQFDTDFLRWLGDVRFTGNVRAMREGTIFFVNEPVIEVTAPIIEAQFVETFVVNQVNLQTILATKASRVVHAARGKPVIDFAARRAHGTDTANRLARVAFLVGFDGTSNLMAGALYGIPVFGTMAHSYVTCFDSEIESFRQFAKSFPHDSTFLVDSYDTLDGVRKAAIVAGELNSRNLRLDGIRLDSGDLLDLSHGARTILDHAGLHDVKVIASGGLDEFHVDQLEQAGAPIDVYCVGTKVGVSADAPWTDCAYKLVEYAGRPVLKLSSEKRTWTSRKQVFRLGDETGAFLFDTIGRDTDVVAGQEALLHEIMNSGKSTHAHVPLLAMRRAFRDQFARLPDRQKLLRSPELYEVNLTASLRELQSKTEAQVQRRELLSESSDVSL